MQQGLFAHLPPFFKLVTIIILVLIGSLLTSLITMLAAQPLFNVDVFSMESMQSNIPFMQAMQIIQSIMVFILPCSIGTILLYNNSKTIIPGQGRYDRITLFLLLSIAFAVIFFSQGFIGWTAWMNQQLQLPESWRAISEWIKSTEDQAMQLTKIMLQTSTWQSILITVFMIAILPAIGEEWLFRGLIQKELAKAMNVHVAIFITAVLFSAIHLQFLTFLPRVVLGLMLGYMMVFTRNLWVPIAAHFFNNFLAVALYWYYGQSNNEELALETPQESPLVLSVMISFVLMLGLIMLTRYISKHKDLNIKAQ